MTQTPEIEARQPHVRQRQQLERYPITPGNRILFHVASRQQRLQQAADVTRRALHLRRQLSYRTLRAAGSQQFEQFKAIGQRIVHDSNREPKILFPGIRVHFITYIEISQP